VALLIELNAFNLKQLLGGMLTNSILVLHQALNLRLVLKISKLIHVNRG
jgi:hypothetical protein